MTTTTRGNIITPDDTTPNDFALAIGNLAQDAMDAVYKEGPISGRPGASTSNKGLIWRATDSTVAGGWFISDGTQWVRLTPSPWVAWTPAVYLADGSGGMTTGVTYSDSAPVRTYRLLPGNLLQFVIEGLVTLSGTQKFTGISYPSPVASARRFDFHGEAMNDLARVRVGDTAFGNAITVYPYGAYGPYSGFVGQWPIDAFNRFVFLNGVYPI